MSLYFWIINRNSGSYYLFFGVPGSVTLTVTNNRTLSSQPLKSWMAPNKNRLLKLLLVLNHSSCFIYLHWLVYLNVCYFWIILPKFWVYYCWGMDLLHVTTPAGLTSGRILNGSIIEPLKAAVGAKGHSCWRCCIPNNIRLVYLKIRYYQLILQTEIWVVYLFLGYLGSVTRLPIIEQHSHKLILNLMAP
jgi:hypothetical protein